MKIVAFLQNQWFREPERVKAVLAYPRHGKTAHEWREYHIAAFLFMGCKTGSRLRQALGEDWISEIIWEEVSREIGGYSSSVFPADFGHIRDVLVRHKPTHVLAFGKVAKDAIEAIRRTESNYPDNSSVRPFAFVQGPHPTARHSTVIEELRAVRLVLDDDQCAALAALKEKP